MPTIRTLAARINRESARYNALSLKSPLETEPETVIRRKSGTASGDHRSPGRTEAATQARAEWRVA